jgi:membrane protease YdiL (CAAX protease family)
VTPEDLRSEACTVSRIGQTEAMEEAPDSPDPSHEPPKAGAVAPSPESIAVVGVPLGSAPTGRAVWREVAVVVAVGVVPNFVGAVQSLCDPATALPLPPLPYWLDSFQLGVLSACTILVTLYIISRSGESWEHFGLPRPQILDLPLGGFMLMVALVVWARVPPIPDFGFGARSGDYSRPHGAGDHILMVVKYALSAFAEELVTRAYLITRLKVLLRSRGEAVLFAALLFACYHTYQGPVGAIHALVFGLTYGVIFLVIGRVWPLAIGHALYNIRIDLLAS